MSDGLLQAQAPLSRGRIRGEILLVLGLSLGASSVYAIVNLVDLSTRSTSLGHQSVALNSSLSDRPVFDLIYQLLAIFFDLVPVALVVYILWQAAKPHLGRLGIDFAHPWRDIGVGVAARPGHRGRAESAVYLGARALGLAVSISADSLPPYWWAVPVLLFSALRAALQEEFIVIGYLYARLRELGWGRWTIILVDRGLPWQLPPVPGLRRIHRTTSSWA